MATPVILPRQGQSVESCIITEILIKKGDEVKEGNLLARYETDKAAFEIEAEISGTVLEVLVEEGDEVPVLDNIMILGEPGEDTSEFKAEGRRQKAEISDKDQGKKDQVVEEQEVTKENLSPLFKSLPRTRSGGETGGYWTEGKLKISPRAKRKALALGVPVANLRGSGPKGRIIEGDVIEYSFSSGAMSPLAAEMAEKTGLSAPVTGSGPGGRVLSSDLQKASLESGAESSVKKLSNIRRIIAEKMHASLQNSAQLTHHMSADARVMLNLRKEIKKKVDTEGYQNVTLNDMVCFAVIKALKKMPEINSHFLGDSIRTFSKVHLGIAVDTERGLMVPALRNADDLSIEQLSTGLKALANSCKSGNIDPDLLAPTAATFTISNLGAFGVEMFTPVINLPQSGILGVNTIITRPGDVGGGIIGFIPYMGLSLTYDHRTIDGAPASAFLREIKEQIENLTILDRG